MISITGWIGCITLSLSTLDATTGLALGRLAFAFASAIPFSLFWMFESFAERMDRRSQIKITVVGLICTAFVLLSLTPWILTHWETSSPRPRFTYGPLHPLFGLYFLLCFAFALYTLWDKLRAASGIRKLQLRYLLLGILIGGAGGITTNLVIPLVWKTSQYSTLGPYFTLVLSVFAAHAIIRHRLMDIRVFIRHSAVYVTAVALAAAGFLTLAALLGVATGYGREQLSLSSALALAIVIAIFFQPLKNAAQQSLNRYLYRRSYDYQRIVREAGRLFSTNLDLESLLNRLVELVEDTLKSEMVSIYLRDEANGVFSRHLAQRPPHSDGSLPGTLPAEGSALISYLARTLQLLVREEATLATTGRLHKAAAVQLQNLGGELALPMLQDRRLFGVLIIGPKLSGDPYFVDDIELLSTLVTQASIALKNAQLYSQVVLVNEYVENILETMDNAVVAVTDTGTVTLFNSAAGRMTGLAADDVKGSSVASLPRELADPIEATLRDSQPRLQAETTVRHRSGKLTPVIYSTSTMRDRSGAVFGVVAVFSDLTRLRELEIEKRRTERLASIGAFAANMAHEIKNPLVAIKTFAELLPERFTEEEFRDQFSKVAIREIERIDELVGRLRALVTHQPKQLAPVDVRELVDEVLSLLRGQLEQARINVGTLYENDLPTVAGDQTQLRQLLLNILINAVEAMPRGGELTVQLSRKQTTEAESLVVAVRDTGPGIPDHFLDKVFDPFVTTKPQGSGLGLSICQGIIEAHRGTIVAENNEPPPGATITISLPIASRAPVTIEPI
jgi:PAS domain S-box-containing protein